jgi:hypothetical protein
VRFSAFTAGPSETLTEGWGGGSMCRCQKVNGLSYGQMMQRTVSSGSLNHW